jgi:DNA repair protein RadD
LALYDREARKASVVSHDAETMATWHGMLLWIQREKNYSPKYARASYHEKFDCWPPWDVTPKPIEPSLEVKAWVRSRLIAYAKRRNVA